MTQTEQPPTFYNVELRGVRYLTERAQAWYGLLSEGDHLSLERELENKVDPKALLAMVNVDNGLPVGWVQRPINEQVVNWMNRGFIYLAVISCPFGGTWNRHLMTIYPLEANIVDVMNQEIEEIMSS